MPCSLKDLLPQFVLLQQVAENQNRSLISDRDPVTDQLDACKTASGEHINQGPLHHRGSK